MKKLLHGLDLTLAVLSPLAIVGFVFAAIILCANAAEHLSLVRKLEDSGVLARATVSYLPADGDIQVTFRDANGAERTHFIRRKYYPAAALATLRLGEAIEIRYLSVTSEYDAVWETHFAWMQGYAGFAIAPGMLMLACWVVVIIHPEFLYLFYEG